MVDNYWNEIIHNPVLFEFFGKITTLLDTLISYACSCVGKIPNENRVKMFLVSILSKENS
jgi:hypothetical protein